MQTSFLLIIHLLINSYIDQAEVAAMVGRREERRRLAEEEVNHYIAHDAFNYFHRSDLDIINRRVWSNTLL